MRYFFLALAFTCTVTAFSQEKQRPLPKGIILKSNLLSLLAQRPTASIEKVFAHNMSAEASFVQGEFNHILFTDHIDYKGYLVRVKKHFSDIRPGAASLYGGVYLGTLKRSIHTAGSQFGSNGWFGYPARDLSANSIRGGESLGCMYISKSRIVVDALMSLGYGRYTKINKAESNRTSKGYLDMQIWFSVGYCF